MKIASTVLPTGPRAPGFRSGEQASYGTYEATVYTKNRAFPITYNQDSQRDMDAWDRDALVRLARHLCRNMGLGKGTLGKMVRYTIGGGFLAHHPDPTYVAWWKNWVKICDYRGMSDLNELLGLWLRGMGLDGEEFIALTETATGYPQLQTIESHRIRGGDPASAGRFNWVDGVLVDPTNRIIGYNYATPDGSNQFISASGVIHLFEPQRSDQIHGITFFETALNNLRDLIDIYGFEKMAVKLNAAIATVITSQAADSNTSFMGGLSKTQGIPNNGGSSVLTLEQILSGGAIPRLRQGEKLEAHHFGRPEPSVQQLAEWLIRDFAVGFQLPYEFVWSAEKLGAQPMKYVLNDAARRFEQLQTFLIRRAMNRIWGWAISKAIKRGDLKARPDWWQVAWQLPRSIIVDAGREAKENREDMKFGIRTHATDAGERGIYWLDERNQQELEMDDLLVRAGRLTKKHGISLDAALVLLQQRAPNPTAQTISGDDVESTGTDVDPEADPEQDGSPAPAPKAAAGAAAVASLDDPEVLADVYGALVRAGVITPNLADEQAIRARVKLPAASAAVVEDWTKSPTRHPITLSNQTTFTEEEAS